MGEKTTTFNTLEKFYKDTMLYSSDAIVRNMQEMSEFETYQIKATEIDSNKKTFMLAMTNNESNVVKKYQFNLRSPKGFYSGDTTTGDTEMKAGNQFKYVVDSIEVIQ